MPFYTSILSNILRSHVLTAMNPNLSLDIKQIDISQELQLLQY